MRSSPWFHQKRSESAPPAQRVKEPPSITVKEQEEKTERLLRPTESALNRQSLYWKLDGYMDRGFHSWSKMDLFSDCKRCMWSGQGSIKDSCKIRPVNVSLPPLGDRSTTCLTARLQTPSTPSTPASSRSRQTGRGVVTWRMNTSGAQGVRGQGRSSVTSRSLPVAPVVSRSATHHRYPIHGV